MGHPYYCPDCGKQQDPFDAVPHRCKEKKMTEANEIQIGGDHYKSKYQHWDFVDDVGLTYHSGCCTKYIARWRFKGQAILDTEKALHYFNKWVELGMKRFEKVFFVIPESISNDDLIQFVYRFSLANDLTTQESYLIYNILVCRTEEQAKEIRNNIKVLINQAKSEDMAHEEADQS